MDSSAGGADARRKRLTVLPAKCVDRHAGDEDGIAGLPAPGWFTLEEDSRADPAVPDQKEVTSSVDSGVDDPPLRP
jgi:hypothetical protein